MFDQWYGYYKLITNGRYNYEEIIDFTTMKDLDDIIDNSLLQNYIYLQ